MHKNSILNRNDKSPGSLEITKYHSRNTQQNVCVGRSLVGSFPTVTVARIIMFATYIFLTWSKGQDHWIALVHFFAISLKYFFQKVSFTVTSLYFLAIKNHKWRTQKEIVTVFTHMSGTSLDCLWCLIEQVRKKQH